MLNLRSGQFFATTVGIESYQNNSMSSRNTDDPSLPGKLQEEVVDAFVVQQALQSFLIMVVDDGGDAIFDDPAVVAVVETSRHQG